MNRPDFRQINRLAESLCSLDADFVKMFEENKAQEAEIQACCARVRRAQAIEALAGIPVEELRSARAGIRVASLEQAGYHTLLDLYKAKDWNLQMIDGIGEKQTASIRMILEEFLNRLSETGRIRLFVDAPPPPRKTTSGNTPSQGASGQDAPAAPEKGSSVTELILLLSRYRKAALVRRDAEPLRQELHERISSCIRAVEIRGMLGWLFSGKQKKERTVLAVGALIGLAGSPLCARGRRLLSMYREAVQTQEQEACADFQKNGAPYYALLETLSGTAAAQETVYSSIPAQLAAKIDAAGLDLRAFRGNLRAYQAFGTRYILTQKRVLLGDEMGLGKTIQAIAAMAHLSVSEMDPEAKKAQKPTDAGRAEDVPTGSLPHFLIVCPASVMINWCRETAKFSDVPVFLLHGAFLQDGLLRWESAGGAAVTNYESMGKVAGRIDGRMRLSLLVIDEAHYIKNPEAKRTRLIHSLEDESERILLMTGTPLENRVEEMCELIGFVRPDMVDAIRQNAAMRHVPAFRQMLAPVYLRRQREQVLEELPPCTEEDEWCAMTPQDLAAYRACAMEESFNGMRRVSFLQEDLRTSSKAMRLLELCGQAQDEGRKIVIYSFFRETIRRLQTFLESPAVCADTAADETAKAFPAPADTGADEIPEAFSIPAHGSPPAGCLGVITGSTPPADRQRIVDRFSDAPPGSILLCQVQAGGTGLNIQAGGVVIFCEPQIKPSLTQQAISRVYRMGQVRNVLVYHLLCEDTVDEAVRKLLEEKQAEFDRFADESTLADAADSLLDREWIRRFLEEEHKKYLPAVR